MNDNFFVLEVTFTPDGPVGKVGEDLGTVNHREAEKILFKKYLKEGSVIVSKCGHVPENFIYKGKKIAGFSGTDWVAPSGESISMIKTEKGFISLYAKSFWDEYLQDNPEDIYLISWEDDWKEQIKLL